MRSSRFNQIIVRTCIPINVLLFFFGIFIDNKEVVGLAGASTLVLLIPRFLLKHEEKENKQK